MSDYIPDSDADKLAWMKQFGVWLTLHGASFGLTPQQIADYNLLVATAETKFAGHNAAKDAAQAARSAKDAGIANAEADARELAQFLQHNPSMTDENRLDAGITAPDTHPSLTSEALMEEILPPLLRLIFNIRRRVTIHWGTNPDNELLNKRPAGTIGCEIQYHIGGIPTEDSAWLNLGLDPESPITHHVNNETPVTVAYRARYVGKNLKYSTYCAPIECSVSV